jgi:hypothetical protein
VGAYKQGDGNVKKKYSLDPIKIKQIMSSMHITPDNNN